MLPNLVNEWLMIGLDSDVSSKCEEMKPFKAEDDGKKLSQLLNNSVWPW